MATYKLRIYYYTYTKHHLNNESDKILTARTFLFSNIEVFKRAQKLLASMDSIYSYEAEDVTTITEPEFISALVNLSPEISEEYLRKKVKLRKVVTPKWRQSPRKI